MLESIIYALIGAVSAAAVADYFSSKVKKQLKRELQAYKRANDYLDKQLDESEKTVEVLRIMNRTSTEQIELKDKEIEFLKALPLAKGKKEICKDTGK